MLAALRDQGGQTKTWYKAEYLWFSIVSLQFICSPTRLFLLFFFFFLFFGIDFPLHRASLDYKQTEKTMEVNLTTEPLPPSPHPTKKAMKF